MEFLFYFIFINELLVIKCDLRMNSAHLKRQIPLMTQLVFPGLLQVSPSKWEYVTFEWRNKSTLTKMNERSKEFGVGALLGLACGCFCTDLTVSFVDFMTWLFSACATFIIYPPPPLTVTFCLIKKDQTLQWKTTRTSPVWPKQLINLTGWLGLHNKKNCHDVGCSLNK